MENDFLNSLPEDFGKQRPETCLIDFDNLDEKTAREKLTSLDRPVLEDLFIELLEAIDYIEEKRKLAVTQKFGQSSQQLILPFEEDILQPQEETEVKQEASEQAESGAIDENTEPVKTQPKKKVQKSTSQKKDPWAGLERVREEHPLSEIPNCPVCGEQFKKIGEKVVQTLEYQKAKIYLKESVYPSYACPNHCMNEGGKEVVISTIDQAEPRLIPGSKATASLMAMIIWNKFGLSLPLDRQAKDMKRNHIPLTKQTMSNWLMACNTLYVGLLVSMMFSDFRKLDIVHLDETTLTCLEVMKAGGNKKCTMVTGVSGEYESRQMALYRFEKTKDQTFVQDMIGENYTGAIMTDGASAYDNYQLPEIYRLNRGSKQLRDQKKKEFFQDQLTNLTLAIHLGCLFHARKKFFDYAQNNPVFKAWQKLNKQISRAEKEERKALIIEKNQLLDENPNIKIIVQILECFASLYQIESECRKYHLNPEQIREVRQEGSKLVFERLSGYVDRAYKCFSKQSGIGKACEYFFKRRDYLIRFCLDGRYPLDNNRAERAVKSVVIGRKNFLFANSIEGAEAAANYYSLVESAKRNDLKVHEYLEYVFETMSRNKITDELVRSLLPYSDKLPERLKVGCQNSEN